MYSTVTHDIQITVLPEFVPERSDADEASFWWAYTVEIANRGHMTVQLTARHWKITDGNGKLEEVKGAGVVGEQPVLKPGETFRYTSGTTMTTPSGIMTGSYRMVNEKGDVFEAEIPVFSLDSPYARPGRLGLVKPPSCRKRATRRTKELTQRSPCLSV
jgi:ApaG protein